MYGRFAVVSTFLCVFVSTFSVFVRCELWVKIPVAIFFSTVGQLATTLDNQEVLQGRIPDFSKGGDFCKGGVTINCPITKICELKACFLYFFYVLAQNGGSLVNRSTPLDLPLALD